MSASLGGVASRERGFWPGVYLHQDGRLAVPGFRAPGAGLSGVRIGGDPGSGHERRRFEGFGRAARLLWRSSSSNGWGVYGIPAGRRGSGNVSVNGFAWPLLGRGPAGSSRKLRKTFTRPVDRDEDRD